VIGGCPQIVAERILLLKPMSDENVVPYSSFGYDDLKKLFLISGYAV
jgi:hypothetical protein